MDSSAELDRLSSRIRAAARDGGLIDTAQVKLIGIDEVRAAAGSRWPRMREHVREGSLKIIASHLGADDAVIACGDGFLAVYAPANADDIARRSNAIREALLKFYLGENALKTLLPELERQTVTPDSLAGLVKDGDAALSIQRQRNQLQLGRFWPIWSPRHRAIVAYLCAPVRETSKAGPRMAYTSDFIERATHPQRDYLDLDLCLLEQACAAAEASAGAAIGVSVHATTMQSRRARETYLQHVRDNATAVKERMFLSVAEIEPGVPLISLCEWSNALRRVFARVAFDLHHSDRALGAIGSTCVWAAGCHLPTNAAASKANVRDVLNQVHAWCRTLRRQGVLPLFHGFEDATFFDLACYSDVGLASGASLWPCLSTPGAQGIAATFANECAGAIQC